MNDTKEVRGQFKYDQDSKRYHRFKIEIEDEDIVGTVYISKKSTPLPDKLILIKKIGQD